MADSDVQRFQALKESMTKTNADISRLQGVQAEKQKQLEAILAKYNCKTVDDLVTLSEKAKQDAEKLAKDITTYLEEAGKAVEEVTALMST